MGAKSGKILRSNYRILEKICRHRKGQSRQGDEYTEDENWTSSNFGFFRTFVNILRISQELQNRWLIWLQNKCQQIYRGSLSTNMRLMNWNGCYAKLWLNRCMSSISPNHSICLLTPADFRRLPFGHKLVLMVRSYQLLFSSKKANATQSMCVFNHWARSLRSFNGSSKIS